MLRGIIRAVATLLILVIIGIVVVTLTGGAFWIGGGIASCPAPADAGDGPIPTAVRGGYEMALRIQAGDLVLQPAVTLEVKPETVTVRARPCRGQ